MFTSTRLKLTGWYLLIIMAISVLFSVVIYYNLSDELERNFYRLQQQNQRLQNQYELFPSLQPIPDIDPAILDTSLTRLRLALLYINIIILVVSASAGYFLAGRTLKPIKRMVDEQNRFVADASHELRTPLTALRTSIEVNLRDKKLSMAEARELLESNLEEVRSLQTLSDDLLLLVRGDTKKNKKVYKLVSIPTVVNEAIDKVKTLADMKKITLKQEVSDADVEGEKEELVRLLVIFLDNAIKYSPEKSMVSVTVSTVDHKVKIGIQDEGMGITKEDLPHIFDRFYRVDKSRSQTQGYGLGLSIARKIIESYNGSVHVDSTVGKGTTFSIILPVYHNTKFTDTLQI